MPEPPARPLASIDEDLRSYCAFRRNAHGELVEVRRRQAELADLEAALVVALEARSATADHLLDERLRASAGVARELTSCSSRHEPGTTAADQRPTATTAQRPAQPAPR